MSNVELTPALSIVTEVDVLSDPTQQRAYYAQIIPSILRGEPVWVRQSFEPMSEITYNLWDRGQYMGQVIAMTDDSYIARASIAVGLARDELSIQLLSLEDARAALFNYACQPEIL